MANKLIYWVVAEVNPKNAGYRVRTMPLVAALRGYGLKPIVLPYATLADTVFEMVEKAACVVLAKPADAEGLMCIRFLQTKNVRVVVDLFDNYFFWSSALYSRGVPWQWFSCMQASSGVITSTDFIAKTVRALDGPPVCLIPDPPPQGTVTVLPADLHAKWQNTSVLEVLWFGINGNPFFNAGLDDLVSWGRVVTYLQQQLLGKSVLRLTICTNPTDAMMGILLMFRDQGIDARYVEWSEQGCNDLLKLSHLVLIPSNLSGFSLSKTHNRCSDALWAQCLVLSSPNGPYQAIPGAVYRDVAQLAEQLRHPDPEPIAQQLNLGRQYVSDNFDLKTQGRRLAQFLMNNDVSDKLGKKSPLGWPTVLIASGKVPGKHIKQSRRMGWMSACFEGSKLKINFDFLLLINEQADGQVTLELSDEAAKLLHSKLDDIQAGWSEVEFDIASLCLTQGPNQKQWLTFSLPEVAQNQRRILELAPFWQRYANLAVEFFNINLDVLMRALAAIGVTQTELASSDLSGWDVYFELGTNPLCDSAKQLRQFWQQVHGNEQTIPALSHGEAACNN